VTSSWSAHCDDDPHVAGHVEPSPATSTEVGVRVTTQDLVSQTVPPRDIDQATAEIEQTAHEPG
jgi:hypothetical protein